MSLFICPLCQSPLQPAVDTWHCDASLNPTKTIHTFDVARQGYVNLLPVQQKKSKDPGDSQASIAARQRFLQAGHYQPLQALLDQQITASVASMRSTRSTHLMHHDDKLEISWLDIGCGEGYYTQTMAATGIDNLLAADISKPALIELAKVSKAAQRLWFQADSSQADDTHSAGHSNNTAKVYPLVTSAANLPIATQRLDGISSIFSPILPETFANVLADEGYLIIAKPDVGHLAKVREALFDDVREHDSDKFLIGLAPFFQLLETHNVSTSLSLKAAALADLLTMTPYAYRARLDKRQALLAMGETQLFETEAKFVVYVLQKIAVN